KWKRRNRRDHHNAGELAIDDDRRRATRSERVASWPAAEPLEWRRAAAAPSGKPIPWIGRASSTVVGRKGTSLVLAWALQGQPRHAKQCFGNRSAVRHDPLIGQHDEKRMRIAPELFFDEGGHIERWFPLERVCKIPGDGSSEAVRGLSRQR